MGHHHHHGVGHQHSNEPDSTVNIRFAFWINTAFALFELAGGWYTNSVAIMADALHDFGDSLSLGLSYFFQKKSNKQRDHNFSYGYKRFSLLGALINSLVLIIGSIFIVQEVIGRLSEPEESNATGMLVFALVGIAVNTVAMLRLRKGDSINEKVVSLHFLEDVLGWVAVLIGSIVLIFYDVPILDPLLSLLITAYVLFNVFKNLKAAMKIILQGVPDSVNLNEIYKVLHAIPGVKGIHDLHVWTMDGQYNVLTMHVVTADARLSHAEDLKRAIRHSLQHQNIAHTTIEIECEGTECGGHT